MIGWRNEDHGIYEVSDDGMFVIAYFTENYIDQPGDGRQLLDGYEYSDVYKLNTEMQCIYAAYSQQFKDAGYSNADDGELQRSTIQQKESEEHNIGNNLYVLLGIFVVCHSFLPSVFFGNFICQKDVMKFLDVIEVKGKWKICEDV